MIYNYHLLFKYIVVGDANVGKSSLLLRFIDDKFTQNYESTLGVEFGSKIFTVGSTIVKTMIWDTAGQQSFKSIIRSYYKNSILALLIFDITSVQTFQNIQKWLEEVKINANEHTRIILIGNKSDMAEKRAVKKEVAQSYANHLNIPYYQTSAKTGAGVTQIFTEPARQLIHDIENKKLIISGVNVIKYRDKDRQFLAAEQVNGFDPNLNKQQTQVKMQLLIWSISKQLIVYTALQYLKVYNQQIITCMPSVATIYIIATTTIFLFTVYEQMQHSSTYFKAIMTYFADQKCVFILYNMILSIAILFYRAFSSAFFVNTMEGQVVKITDKLKSKIVDLIILAYIIDLKFNFQMYLLVAFVVFTYILHNHLVFRSQYLVHIHTTSNALSLHYRAIALYLLLFFVDYQILKYILVNMLSVTEATEALFVYYMVTNAFLLLEPFMQFAVDFYEKYTFSHIRNSDQLIATVSVLITIPKLIIQLILCLWLSFQFKQIFFAIIRGIEIISNIKKTYESYIKIKKLSQTMTHLKKLKGQQLQQFHDLTCTVCYQDMKQAILLPCKHIFHEQCIRQWIIKNLNHFCPKCKHELNFDKVQNLYEQKKKQTPLDRMRILIQQQHKSQKNEISSSHKQSHQQTVQPQQEEQKREKTPVQYSYFNKKEQRQYERQYDKEEQFIQQYSQSQQEYQRQINEPRLNNQKGQKQRIQIVDKSRRPIAHKQYIINKPDLSEFPLEVYQSMRKSIVPIGALPYGMPTMAVSSRRRAHMAKREQYIRDMEIITRLLQMDRNQQLLLL